MQRLLLLITFVVLPWLTFAAEVEELVLFHRSGETELADAEVLSIAGFFASFEGQIVEKLNIHGYTLDFVSQGQNADRTKLRLQEIYTEVLKHMEDTKNIELININEVAVSPTNSGSYTRFEVYLLDKKSKNSSPAVEKDLFPEEFIQLDDDTYIPAVYAKDSKFEIRDVQFHGNSSVFTKDSESILQELKKFLLLHPEVKIKIVGHVNGRLSKAYLKEAGRNNPERKVYRNSEHLSHARAQSIKTYLVEEGISHQRIEIEGKGADDMIYKSPKNKRQEAANRRIEVVIL